MESVVAYGIISILLGLLLLFFGLKLMKFTVGVIGFLIGYSIVYSLAASAGWSDVLHLGASVLSGLVVAAVAFAFYKFAVELSIALFFGNMAYVFLILADLDTPLAVAIGIVAGIASFIIVRALKVVEVLFALMTSLQGALLITAALYLFIFPAQLGAVQSSQLDVILRAEVWWSIGWIVLAAFGFISQLSSKTPTHATE